MFDSHRECLVGLKWGIVFQADSRPPPYLPSWRSFEARLLYCVSWEREDALQAMEPAQSGQSGSSAVLPLLSTSKTQPPSEHSLARSLSND